MQPPAAPIPPVALTVRAGYSCCPTYFWLSPCGRDILAALRTSSSHHAGGIFLLPYVHASSSHRVGTIPTLPSPPVALTVWAQSPRCHPRRKPSRRSCCQIRLRRPPVVRRRVFVGDVRPPTPVLAAFKGPGRIKLPLYTGGSTMGPACIAANGVRGATIS